MTATFGIADYVVLGITLAVSTAIGIYFRFSGGKQKTVLEYLLANKSMGILPVSFSVLATMTSAITIVGRPTEIYLYGPASLMTEASYAIAVCIVTYCMLPVYFEMDVNSIYEYIEKRFGKVVKTAISIFYTLQMLLYVPVVIYAPALALSTTTGLSVWTSVVSMALVCTFYSTLGGLKAVLWTDSFQTIMMFFTVLALFFKGSIDSGGFLRVYELAKEGQRTDLFNTNADLTIRYTLWNCLMHGLIFGALLNGTNFHAIQRLISCGNLKKAQCALLWSIPMCIVFQLLARMLGIVMYSYFNQCDPISNKDILSGDQLVPLFVMRLFGHLDGLPGLCVAGIFSASLSTMSSVINSMSFVTLEDFIKPFLRINFLKESTAALIVKILVLFYGGLCLCLTYVVANVKGILEASVSFQTMVGGPILGVFCLGMFTSKANEIGSMMGLFAGFLIMAWTGFGSLYNKTTYPFLPLSTAGCPRNLSSTLFDPYSNTNGAVFNNDTDSSMMNSTTNDRYVFPLYKVSFMWYSAISFFSSFIVGYAASCIIGFWKKGQKVEPQYISPVVRKWICRSSTRQRKTESIILAERQKMIGANLNEDQNEEV